jgi:hypothetical protein
MEQAHVACVGRGSCCLLAGPPRPVCMHTSTPPCTPAAPALLITMQHLEQVLVVDTVVVVVVVRRQLGRRDRV